MRTWVLWAGAALFVALHFINQSYDPGANYRSAVAVSAAVVLLIVAAAVKRS